MEDADVKQKVYDLFMEQKTLNGTDSDAKIADLIFRKFGKKCTVAQVTAARAALRQPSDSKDIPRPEVLDQ